MQNPGIVSDGLIVVVGGDLLNIIAGNIAVRTAPDSASADIIYFAKASPGTADNVPLWSIQRLTEGNSIDDLVIEWADGDSNQDNIWDNRESLTYS